MSMKKSMIVVVVSFVTSTFGIEPSEVVRLYRAALTNNAALGEFEELVRNHKGSIEEAMSRMNGLELILMDSRVDSVSVTPTNVVITFRNVENGEKGGTLILTPDNEASLSGYSGGLFFAPVTFKDKRMGFQVRDSVAHMEYERHNVAYIVLGDKPTEVSKDDVAMILDKGEWKTIKEYRAAVEQAKRLMELRLRYIDKRSEAQKLLQGEALTNRLSEIEQEAKLEWERIKSDTQVEPSETKTGANNHWLCALIPLCFLAILYFLRRKKR
jgi:hypothetical protein